MRKTGHISVIDLREARNRSIKLIQESWKIEITNLTVSKRYVKDPN